MIDLAIICDEDILPPSLLETRPVTAMQQDGSYKGDYAESRGVRLVLGTQALSKISQ
jgi:hypothetical protein